MLLSFKQTWYPPFLVELKKNYQDSQYCCQEYSCVDDVDEDLASSASAWSTSLLIHFLPTHGLTTALPCTALHCSAVQCTALHCTALHCTALHSTVLHCPALQPPAVDTFWDSSGAFCCVTQSVAAGEGRGQERGITGSCGCLGGTGSGSLFLWLSEGTFCLFAGVLLYRRKSAGDTRDHCKVKHCKETSDVSSTFFCCYNYK